MDSIHNILHQEKVDKHLDSILGIVSKIKDDKNTLTKTASTDIEVIDKYINGEDVRVNVPLNKILEAQKEDDDLDSEIDLLESNIKIISKDVKDPHYDIFVSRASVKKHGENILVVSFFLKENYLGRYLINRNYYFLKSNKKESKDLFDYFVVSSKLIRNEYYDEKFESIKIPIMLQNIAMSKVGDFEFEEESKLGTTVFNKHKNEATVYEWFQNKKEKYDERRYQYWLDDIMEEDKSEEDEGEESKW